MNNLNSILIEGNLTHDPELGTIPNGTSKCRFSIASNRYYRNSEKALVNEVAYVNVDTWGALAESCGKYLRKGRGVRVVGRLKQDRWQGEDEKMRERFVIVAEHVEFHPDPQWKEGSRDEEITLEDKVDGQEDNMVFETPTKTKPKKK
ncbi:MAG: single-stranded DNA-binding protein [Sphaerochaetaceae bacterium]|jgi:single-strand DNA-binding protein|nr:single-stranded DNA-binding protein [Sphaerochaetaceae bacterium]